MMVLRGLASASAFALAAFAAGGCNRTESGAAPPGRTPASRAAATLAGGAGRATPAATQPLGEERRAATPPVELPPVAARGSLLHRLPKTALLAVRLPHVERLKEAWKRTPLDALLQMPQLMEQRAQMEEGLRQMAAEIRKQLPDFESLHAKVRAFQGEVVFALVSLDARALSRSSGGFADWPFTVALLYDAGARADDVDAVLQRLFAAAEPKRDKEQGPTFEVVAAGKERWHRRVKRDGACVDFARDGAQFVVQFGPAAATAAAEPPLPARALDDSFVAADVVRATPDLAKSGSLPVAEVFVNLAPVWTAMEVLAPAEVRSVLAGSGATSIGGLSLASGLGRKGIDEVFFLHSPGGKDLLTQVLTSRPFDPRLARYVPPDAAMAQLTAFDFAALVDGVLKLVPPAAKKEFDGALAAMKGEGFDLRGDLIGNVGPTFGWVGNADFVKLYSSQAFAGPESAALRGALEFTLLVELQDSARFKRMIDRFLRSSGIAAHVRPEVVQGVATSRLESFPVPGPNGEMLAVIEPSWHVGERAFVFSTSNAALERALAAARDAGNRGPPRMRELLAKPDPSIFSIAASSGGEGLPAEMSIGRRTPFGLELCSREGPGYASAYVLGGGTAMVAAIAIPNLLQARLSANETVAVTTLKAIAAAETEFRARAFVDQDGDGRGEYGTLAELAGSAPPAGARQPISPPPLAIPLSPDGQSCFSRSGYVFRVDVPRRAIGGADAAEKRFVAYAWPMTFGGTGGKAYVIDAEGKIFFSDNRGDQQRYEGIERTPATDASELRDEADRIAGVTAVRRGRDGGIWLELE